MNNSLQDKYRRLQHTIYVICWVVIFSIPVLMQAYGALSGLPYRWSSLIDAYGILVPIYLMFLLNNRVLLPRLFWGGHRMAYAAVVLALLAVLWLAQPLPFMPIRTDAPGPPPGDERGVDMFHVTNLFIELCVLLGNFAIKLYFYSLDRDLQLYDARNERMRSELDSLRYQVSPHFLMNTLNNIQSLIDIDKARAYESIQHLSNIMRYMLYENDHPLVRLNRECWFIDNYISLMRIRYPEMVRISVSLPDDDEGAMLPPLLFISLIENAFKYGISYTGQSVIDVSVMIVGDDVVFRCSNTVNPVAVRNHRGKGIGQENVRRRLQLIYNGNARLQTSDTDNLYLAEIIIPKHSKELENLR